MFNNSSKILFLLTLMSGTLITISSTSWLSAWMGLEINLLSFIPLMNDSSNLMSTETSLKYFLTQAIASSIFLAAVLISMLKINLMNFQLIYYPNMLITTALLIKSGTAPFHFWFPSIMEGLNWTNSIILMTWQKIAPLILVSYIFISNLMYFVIIISTITGAIGGLNQTSLRKLMAFSSINHLSWMLAAMMHSSSTFIMYFIFYSFLSITVIFLLNSFKIFHFNQLFTSFSSYSPLKFSFFINLLSLGGLPPFLGFLPKWIVIQNLTNINQMSLMLVLILFSMVTLYFYLRICYSAFMIGNSEFNWNLIMFQNNKFLNKMILMSFISTMGLSFISLIYFFI
uniref:NADH-ubiquinone oxidoreductase chain 2 n=1 Tax=Tinda javana TaxID=931524 RepID=A0A7S8J2C4_9DIPT|nr:NADH dehydrogenase subunit 2 [Tinda javana]QPD06981.1 NADH dehydrogenase subunit 2 [Tinda javana]